MSEDNTDSSRKKRVRISDLISASRCPRRYYFESGKERPVSGKYIICKQVSLHPESDDETLWSEVQFIFPEITEDLRSYLSDCASVFRHAPHLTYTDLDLRVSSQKYAISGQIDKYDEEKRHFVLVRSSQAPSIGCWPQDRLRMAAYQLCLQEQKKDIPFNGYIEYIPSGVVRICEPQPRDRRALLAALSTVLAVQRGEIPRKPGNAPCDRCSYKTSCMIPVHRLSEII